MFFESSDFEFLEICSVVGMINKPYHVRTFQIALNRWVKRYKAERARVQPENHCDTENETNAENCSKTKYQCNAQNQCDAESDTDAEHYTNVGTVCIVQREFNVQNGCCSSSKS